MKKGGGVEGGRLAWHECAWRVVEEEGGRVGRYQRRGANCESCVTPCTREKERGRVRGREGGQNEGWIEWDGRPGLQRRDRERGRDGQRGMDGER